MSPVVAGKQCTEHPRGREARQKEFIVVQCRTINDGWNHSQLFGLTHKRGEKKNKKEYLRQS